MAFCSISYSHYCYIVMAYLCVIITQISGQTGFWQQLKTTNRPLYGAPNLPDWYLQQPVESGSSEESNDLYDDRFYGVYLGAGENRREAYVPPGIMNNAQQSSTQPGRDTYTDDEQIQNDTHLSGEHGKQLEAGQQGEEEEEEEEEEEYYDYEADYPVNSDEVAEIGPESTNQMHGFSSNDPQLGHLEKCPEQPTVKNYCRRLADGDYFDPWNPFCGYIRCTDQRAQRHLCADGSWMGISSLVSARSMCRQRVALTGDGTSCPVSTDYALCRHARRVLNQDNEAE